MVEGYRRSVCTILHEAGYRGDFYSMIIARMRDELKTEKIVGPGFVSGTSFTTKILEILEILRKQDEKIKELEREVIDLRIKTGSGVTINEEPKSLSETIITLDSKCLENENKISLLIAENEELKNTILEQEEDIQHLQQSLDLRRKSCLSLYTNCQSNIRAIYQMLPSQFHYKFRKFHEYNMKKSFYNADKKEFRFGSEILDGGDDID